MFNFCILSKMQTLPDPCIRRDESRNMVLSVSGCCKSALVGMNTVVFQDKVLA